MSLALVAKPPSRRKRPTASRGQQAQEPTALVPSREQQDQEGKVLLLMLPNHKQQWLRGRTPALSVGTGARIGPGAAAQCKLLRPTSTSTGRYVPYEAV